MVCDIGAHYLLNGLMETKKKISLVFRNQGARHISTCTLTTRDEAFSLSARIIAAT